MYRFLVASVAVVGLLMAPLTSTRAAGQVAEEAPPKKTRTPDVVYVPTPHDVVAKMLDLVKVKKGEVVYDLGCGDGRIVVEAAKRGATATGFDIDPQRIKEARENVKKNKVEKLAKIKQEDIFTLDLRDANVITLYLLPRLNVKLIPQLEKLKAGSRIVSHDFDMEGVTPDRVVRYESKEDGVGHTIYVWTTPLKKEKKKADAEE